MARKKNNSEGQKESKVTLHTLEMNPEQIEKIREYCDYHLWEAFEPDYAHYGFKNKAKQVTLVAFRSGKVVISGKGTQEFVQDYIEPQITGEAYLGYEEVHHPEWFEEHAGLDEAGKGDLFGPVVATTVVADEVAVRQWRKAGIKDSKSLSDDSIQRLEKIILKTPGVVVQSAWCSMEKYNALMAKPTANLNKLLAWLHARALTSALEKRPAPWGLLDQFSKQPLVQRQLKKDGVDFDLRMRTHGESDPVVAAASVCARAEFVRQMKKLEEVAGEPLLKGAGAAVKEQAQRLVGRHGPDVLPKIAKMHFRTASEVLGLPVPEKKPFQRG